MDEDKCLPEPFVFFLFFFFPHNKDSNVALVVPVFGRGVPELPSLRAGITTVVVVNTEADVAAALRSNFDVVIQAPAERGLTGSLLFAFQQLTDLLPHLGSIITIPDDLALSSIEAWTWHSLPQEELVSLYRASNKRSSKVKKLAFEASLQACLTFPCSPSSSLVFVSRCHF